MKPTHLLLIALFALTVGCKTTETLTSSGTEGTEKPDVSQTTGSGTEGGIGELGSGTTLPDTKTEGATKDPLATTGANKPTDPAVKPEVKAPTPGAAATNPAVTAKTLIGKYEGKLFEETIKFLLSLAPPEKRAEAENELRTATISLELATNGRYTMVTKSKQATESNTGTWKYDEKTGIATMNPPDVNAETVAKMKAMGATDEQIAASRSQTMQCQVSKDGRTLTFEQTQMGMKNGITFTKR